MITRKIIINDFHLSLFKSCLIDVFRMLAGTILYGQQPSFRIYCPQPPGCLKQLTAAVAAVAGLWRLSLTLQLKLS